MKTIEIQSGNFSVSEGDTVVFRGSHEQEIQGKIARIGVTVWADQTESVYCYIDCGCGQVVVSPYKIVRVASPVKVLTYAEREQCALEEMRHRGDGPVTVLGVISRAIELARAGKFLPCNEHDTVLIGTDPIANALFIALGLGDET